ncbi:MAG: VPLPA-CTERM sorting domain-containing protein [Pseudomonadota bacterium]
MMKIATKQKHLIASVAGAWLSLIGTAPTAAALILSGEGDNFTISFEPISFVSTENGSIIGFVIEDFFRSPARANGSGTGFPSVTVNGRNQAISGQASQGITNNAPNGELDANDLWVRTGTTLVGVMVGDIVRFGDQGPVTFTASAGAIPEFNNASTGGLTATLLLDDFTVASAATAIPAEPPSSVPLPASLSFILASLGCLAAMRFRSSPA